MADIFNMTDTWNNGGTNYTSILMDVTNTASAGASYLMNLKIGGSSKFSVDQYGTVAGDALSFTGMYSASSSCTFATSVYIGWSTSSNPSGSIDTTLSRKAAGIVAVRGNTTGTTGAALNFLEQTAPSAPSSNEVVIYAEDNGAGKTRLMALFPTGAAQQIAIEP